MGIVLGVILVILLIYLMFFRFLWAICKPIFVFLYDGIINFLIRTTGMTINGARALISLVFIIIILWLIF